MESLKKPRGAVRVELLNVSLRDEVDQLLDDHVKPKRIEGRLRNEGIKSVTARDLEVYNGWRHLVAEGRVQEENDESSGSESAETKYTPKRVSHEHIISVLAGKIALLVEEASKDPSSEANKVIKALLLEQMVNAEMKVTEQDVHKIMQAEDRGNEMKQKYANELSKRAHEKREFQFKQKIYRDKQQSLEKTTHDFRADLAAGKPVDPEAMLRQIEAVIGISGELVERVEPQARLS